MYETETQQIHGLEMLGYDNFYNEIQIKRCDGVAFYTKQSINHESYVINLSNIKILQIQINLTKGRRI